MDDRGIEDLLKRYQPAGPRPELRARIARDARQVRIWPWAVAASLLLGASVALHFSSGRIAQGIIVSTPDPVRLAVGDLAEMLGGDDLAQRFAQAEIARLRRAAAAPPFPESETP